MDQGPNADRNTITGIAEINELFFARQTVQNSCATHALLSILLNRPELDLGPMLSEFQKATRQLSPEAKGTAIGSMPQLAQAHNRHAAQPHSIPSHQSTNPLASPVLEPSEAASAAAAASAALALSNPGSDSTSTVTTTTTSSSASAASTGAVNAIQLDTFHFVCYVPFGGFLYELDGLKPDPINHGPLQDPTSSSDWTRQCADILRQRMQEQDVRYSLMAVVPDRRLALTKRMYTLDKNRQIIEDTLLRIARYEENQKRQRSVDFRAPINGTVVESGSPLSSVLSSRSGFDSTLPSMAMDADRKECTSPFAPSDPGPDDREMHTLDNMECHSALNDSVCPPKQHNRSIRTRSLTRSTASTTNTNPGEAPSSCDADDMPHEDMPSRQSLDFHSSVAPQSGGGSPISDVGGTNRKRSSTSSTLDEDETAWVSERKRRFLEEPIDRASCSDMGSTGGDGANSNGSVFPYGQMNKMLASIVSVESPLLTTLTEVVAAAAQDVSDTLDESRQVNYQSLKPSDSPRALSTLIGGALPSSDNANRTIPCSRSPEATSEANEIVKLEEDEQSTKKVSEIQSASSKNGTNHLSFSSAFISSESDLPSELTKPLTVDTQLWDRARLISADRLESTLPNGVIPLGRTTAMKQAEDTARSTTTARELRPQTRALTRARVKNHTETESHSKSIDCAVSDSIEQPSSSNSPTPLDSPTATRSPCSPQAEHAIKRDPSTDKEFRVSHTPDESCSTLNESAISSGVSLSGTVTTITSSCDSIRRASKYPTRSSTKRDTLASHSLASCRTNTTTATAIACNAGTSPNSITSQINHHGMTFRPELSCASISAICADTKVDRSDSNRGYPIGGRLHETVPRFTADELRLLLNRVKEQAKLCDAALLEEEEKRQTYRVDDARRVHNYEPFIRAYLTALAKHGLLRTLVVQALQNMPNTGTSLSLLSPTASSSSTRKSSGSVDPPYHSRRSDSDRSVSVPKSSVGSTEITAESERNIALRRLSDPQSTTASVGGQLTRRGLRARGKRGTFVSGCNRSTVDRGEVYTTDASDGTTQSQNKPTICSPGPRNNHTTEAPSDTVSGSSITTDGMVNSTESELTESAPVVGAETPDSLGSHSAKSKSQTISPVLSNTTRNGTADASESGSGLQAPLSPLASSVAHTSYSSCGSAPQSPQSSTSSRSTYLRPLRQNARSDSSGKFAAEDGFISRKSLRPRSSTDRSVSRGGNQPGLSDSSDEQKSGNGHRLFLRRRTFSSLVKHVDSGILVLYILTLGRRYLDPSPYVHTCYSDPVAESISLLVHLFICLSVRFLTVLFTLVSSVSLYLSLSVLWEKDPCRARLL
ncbi:unnamed protein product [Echinostoma caproni]|uniref:ubiquitinyl hydrolase 1 n=1 Tax=Echinostoma caproni TaxID=27848 RepID=A0A183ACT9_9TREM|nr:unnamed protein product [Echinostoma caproni]